MKKRNGEDGNKADLLKAITGELTRLVDRDFDGNIIITSRKGHLGKLRGVPRETMLIFDPNEEKKRLLTE